MKKWTLALVLLMCMALVMPVSAEQTAYVPGEISNQLISEAFASGQMVGGSMMISLDLDEEKLAILRKSKIFCQAFEFDGLSDETLMDYPPLKFVQASFEKAYYETLESLK